MILLYYGQPFLGIFCSKHLSSNTLQQTSVLSTEYTVCHAFFPVVRIGSLHSPTRKEVLYLPPLGPRGEIHCGGRRWGDLIRTTGGKAWHSVCSVLGTYYKDVQRRVFDVRCSDEGTYTLVLCMYTSVQSIHIHSPDHRVHTEWRLPISGVHPIMMEKSALAGEGGGCMPIPFQPITITYKVAVYAPAERTDTLPLFHLYPIFTLWSRQSLIYISLRLYSYLFPHPQVGQKGSLSLLAKGHLSPSFSISKESKRGKGHRPYLYLLYFQGRLGLRYTEYNCSTVTHVQGCTKNQTFPQCFTASSADTHTEADNNNL